MAYDTQEERLKVRGSEQITRDLKVNRDAFILGNLEAGEVKSNGDLDVQGELIARKDLSVSGDLYVNGTEHINDTETAQTSDDYLVLRHNKTTALGANEHAGIVVHNYMPNKTATLTTDNTGTWRVADNTETETNYSNISYYNGTYYSGLGQGTTATVIDGIKSAWDEDELSECVFYNNDYYHFDGSNYFEVELSGNVMVLGTMVTDPDVITALEALTGYDLVYFRSLSVTTINEVENQPLLTRDETSNLSNGDVLAWDATGEKAVAATGVAKTSDITDAINALDVTDSAVAGQYVSSVSETNGVISVTRATIPASENLDWSNAETISVGSLRCAAASQAITVVDRNGTSHSLIPSGPQSFNISWSIPKKGKLFPLVRYSSFSSQPYVDTDYYVGIENIPKYLRMLPCDIILTSMGPTPETGDPIFFNVHRGSTLVHAFKSIGRNTIIAYSYSLITSTTPNKLASSPKTTLIYATGTFEEQHGIEVEVGDLVSSAQTYAAGIQPPVGYITDLLFVPYK